jgi:hypothetical protein
LLAPIGAALLEQGWYPGRRLAAISDGEAALPNLVRAAIGEPVRHILDWFHLSIRMRRIEQVLTGLSARQLQNPVPSGRAASTQIVHLASVIGHFSPSQIRQSEPVADGESDPQFGSDIVTSTVPSALSQAVSVPPIYQAAAEGLASLARRASLVFKWRYAIRNSDGELTANTDWRSSRSPRT